MVIVLNTNLETLLEQIEVEGTVNEVVITPGEKGFERSSSLSDPIYFLTCLRNACREFYTRYREEIIAMRFQGIEPPSFDNYWHNEVGRHLVEAFKNANLHGNRLDTNKKIKFTLHYGKRGVVYIIEDEGNGFDYRDIEARRHAGDLSYAVGHAWGMRSFDEQGIVVTFNEKGNAVFIQYLLSATA